MKVKDVVKVTEDTNVIIVDTETEIEYGLDDGENYSMFADKEITFMAPYLRDFQFIENVFTHSCVLYLYV